MKSTYLTPVAVVALLFGCAIANAQSSSDPSANKSSMPPTSQADTTKGNDLVDSSQANPPNMRHDPRSDGENKADGNDMVSGFNTLDTKKNGYLTADDVKGNKWLSKNFAKCDTDHDGQLSREEYANCHQ